MKDYTLKLKYKDFLTWYKLEELPRDCTAAQAAALAFRAARKVVKLPKKSKQ